MKEPAIAQAVDNYQAIRANDVAINSLEQHVLITRQLSANGENKSEELIEDQTTVISNLMKFIGSFFASPHKAQEKVQQLTHESEQLLAEQEERLQTIQLAQGQLLQDNAAKIRELQQKIEQAQARNNLALHS